MDSAAAATGGPDLHADGLQSTGNKVTWKTRCTGEMEMTGEGEITFDTPESYSGFIKFAAEGITMNVTLSGTKIDECDNPIG